MRAAILSALLLLPQALYSAKAQGTPKLVLWLDASEAGTAASIDSGVWQDRSDYSNDLQLFNADFDPAWGGSVVFTPAPAGSEDGTFGVRTKAAGVTAGAWGENFTAIAWFKPARAGASPAQTLLQVLGSGSSYSALWQLGDFSDRSAIGLQGFASAPAYNASLSACWQQLAVVKAGPSLAFYYNAAPAGNGAAASVVRDYGSTLAVGVDYAALLRANATGGPSTSAPLSWLNGSLGSLLVFDGVLGAGDVAALYARDAPRFQGALCSSGNATQRSPLPSGSPVVLSSPRPSTSPGSPALSPSPAPSVSPNPPVVGSSPAPAPSAAPGLSPQLSASPAPAPSSQLQPSPSAAAASPQPQPSARPASPSPVPKVPSPSPAATAASPLPPFTPGGFVTFAYDVTASDLEAYTQALEAQYKAGLSSAFNVAESQINLTSVLLVNATISGAAPANAVPVYTDLLNLTPDQLQIGTARSSNGTQSHYVAAALSTWDEVASLLEVLNDAPALQQAVGLGRALVGAPKTLLRTSASVALTPTQSISTPFIGQLISQVTAANLALELIDAGMPLDTTVVLTESPNYRSVAPQASTTPSPLFASPSPSPAAKASPSPALPPSTAPASSSPRASASPAAVPASPSPKPQLPASPSAPASPAPKPSPSPAGPVAPRSPAASPAAQPQPTTSPPTTLDTSTADVTPQGVSNQLTIKGTQDLLPFDAVKQQQLKAAIVNSLNVDPSYTADNVILKVLSVNGAQQPAGGRRLRQITVDTTVEVNVTVVVEYTLQPTPACPVPVLAQAEVQVKLFIRVQVDVIPWFQGNSTICQSNTGGNCTSQPVTPPVVIDGCTVDVCFLLDDSGSIVKVDAWNDETAAARSIMESISGRSSVFAVYRFSNFVEPLGTQTTRGQLATDNSLIRTILETTPRGRGTYTADAIRQCQTWLSGLTTGHPRTILLLTDGQPTDPTEALAAAAAAKAAGNRIVAVGAGDINFEMLSQMSSGPDAVFASNELDTAQLLRLADSAAQGVCAEQ